MSQTKNAKGRLRYQKPLMKAKKVTVSFFLSKIALLDQFNILGNVYAQSGSDGGYGGGTSWASTNTGDCGSSASPGEN